MKIRIFDTQNGLLISLLGFLKFVFSKQQSLQSAEWKIVRAVSGYGKNVCRIEDELEDTSSIPIVMPELISWLEDGEYFTSARLVCEKEGVKLGIEDSTFLFAETVSVELIEEIRFRYNRTQAYD